MNVLNVLFSNFALILKSEQHVERLNGFKLLVSPITSGTFVFSFSFIDNFYMSCQGAFVVITSSIANMALQIVQPKSFFPS